MRRTLGLALTALTLGQAGANDVMPPGELAAQTLLSAPRVARTFTLEGAGHRPVKMQISLPGQFTLDPKPWGRVSEEARAKLRPGPLNVEMEFGIWQNAGMFGSTGVTTTRTDGRYSVTTARYASGDVTVRVTWPEPKINRTLVCSADVTLVSGLSRQMHEQLVNLSVTICKSFRPA